jgi:hypothetical protein
MFFFQSPTRRGLVCERETRRKNVRSLRERGAVPTLRIFGQGLTLKKECRAFETLRCWFTLVPKLHEVENVTTETTVTGTAVIGTTASLLRP